VKHRKEKDHYLLILEKGEELTRSLTEFVTREGIHGGVVRGLGGVTNVHLGFFDTEKKEYLRKEFDGFYELASLVGDISLVDGKPFCHLHAVISDSEMRTFAGHLLSARISVTGEIMITPGEKVERKFDEEIGLNLIEP
jgi:predicted DNA-binding protein with PD1-like motif